MLKKDVHKTFEKVTSPDIIEYYLNNLGNDFEYLFLTFSLSMYNAD